MTNDLQKFMGWTFVNECSVPADINDLLVDGERALCAYKTIRDVAVFTNKRLIVRDAQGLTGKKVECYTLPYSSIIMYSTENAGVIDFNSEVELWTKAGTIKINLKRNVDIRALDKVLASCILL